MDTKPSPTPPLFLMEHTRGQIAVLIEDTETEALVVTRPELSPRWELWTLPKDDADFKRRWRQWEPTVHPVTAPEPIPIEPVVALRKIVEGTMGIQPSFGDGVLEALTQQFPEGPWHLFDPDFGFIHRFSTVADLHLIARRRVATPIVFGSEQDLQSLPRKHLDAVAAALGAKQPPAKTTKSYFKELYTMAKKAKAKKAVASKRSDGPVAKLWAMYAKVSDPTDTAKMLEIADKAGINPATAKTQLYKFRKQNGIKSARTGGAAKKSKAKGAKKVAKKPAAKAKGKKKTASKGAARLARSNGAAAPAAASESAAPAGE